MSYPATPPVEQPDAAYRPERYIRPSVNLSVWLWLFLLGLPALLLFLIYSAGGK